MASFGAFLMLGGCSVESTAEVRRPTVYRCADGRSFSVEQSAEIAHVEYRGMHYQLPRRSSGIGIRYGARGTTLIIDGDMAVFVTQHVLDLQACHIVRV